MSEIFSGSGDSYTKSELLEALRDGQQRIHELEGLIEESKWVEQALRKRTRELGERIKELDCLYKISEILMEPGRSLDEIIQHIVQVMPSGWQEPDRTSVQIVLPNKTFRNPCFQKSERKQVAEVHANGQRLGTIDVYVAWPLKASAEQAFLPEEQALLNAIALWIGEIIEHRVNDTALDESVKPLNR